MHMYNTCNTCTHIYTWMAIHVYTHMNLDDFTAVLLIVIGKSLGLKHSDRCTTGPLTQ